MRPNIENVLPDLLEMDEENYISNRLIEVKNESNIIDDDEEIKFEI